MTTKAKAANQVTANQIISKIDGTRRSRRHENACYVIRDLGNGIDTLSCAIGNLTAWALNETLCDSQIALSAELGRLIDIANRVAAHYGIDTANYWDHEGADQFAC